MLEKAIAYTRRGWVIIPISPYSKKPPKGFNWGDYKEPDEKLIRKWFSEDGPYYGYNLGLVCGKASGVFVVDIDVPDMVDEIVAAAPTGRVSQTGRGGTHLFYNYPKGVDHIPNRVGIVPGVDIRGDEGYIVLPPSTSQHGPYKWVKRGKIENIPYEMLQNIIQKEEGPVTVNLDSPKEKWVSNLMQGVSSGGRNAACSRLAGYYLSKNIPKDVVLAMMYEWNAKNGPPLPDREVKQTVDSVAKTRKRKGQDKQDDDYSELEDTSFDVESVEDYLRDFGDFETKWTIEEWLPKSSIHFMVAPPESFKTWILLDMLVSIASGLPFLGKYPVKQPGPVLMVQQEDWHGILTERLSLIMFAKYGFELPRCVDGVFMAEFPPELPIYVHKDAKLRFENPEIMDNLEKVVKRFDISYCFIDPFYTTIKLNNYGADAVQSMMRLKRIRNETGCGFSIVHHTSKNNPNNKEKKNNQQQEELTIDREQGWGSQLVNGFMESGLQIRKSDKNDMIAYKRHFKTAKSDSSVGYLKFEIDIKSDPVVYKVSKGSVSETKDTEEEIESVDIVGLLKEYGPLKSRDIARSFPVSISVITEKIKKLVKDRVIEKDVKGLYRLARSYPKF